MGKFNANILNLFKFNKLTYYNQNEPYGPHHIGIKMGTITKVLCDHWCCRMNHQTAEKLLILSNRSSLLPALLPPKLKAFLLNTSWLSLPLHQNCINSFNIVSPHIFIHLSDFCFSKWRARHPYSPHATTKSIVPSQFCLFATPDNRMYFW